jgi:hypothetical protein
MSCAEHLRFRAVKDGDVVVAVDMVVGSGRRVNMCIIAGAM